MNIADEILARVRDRPAFDPDDLRSLMRETLSAWVHAMDASAAVVTWEDREEPGLTVASLDSSGFRWNEIADVEAYRPLVAPEHTGRVFRDGDAAIHPDLRRDYALQHAIAIPLDSESFEGMVFITGASFDGDAPLCVGAAMTALLGLRMDAVVERKALRAQVAGEERMRIARDLHDGLLQSFTGIVLQLETVHALLSHDPQDAARLLTQVQASIMSDQRELRALVESLRPRRRAELAFDFAARLHEIRERFQNQWGIEVVIHTSGVDPHVGSALGQETFRLVQEAVTNSARHGGASRVDVWLRTTDGMLVLDVADDGVGLPVRGRLTLAELRERGIGPASLRDRVAALNGSLIAESSDSGLRLEIALPLGWSGA